jgi:hypothetical protein
MHNGRARHTQVDLLSMICPALWHIKRFIAHLSTTQPFGNHGTDRTMGPSVSFMTVVIGQQNSVSQVQYHGQRMGTLHINCTCVSTSCDDSNSICFTDRMLFHAFLEKVISWQFMSCCCCGEVTYHFTLCKLICNKNTLTFTKMLKRLLFQYQCLLNYVTA